MADRAGFEDFVLTRSPRLLRVCYLLTRDWSSAQDLLQAALTKAWFAWDRVQSDPESYVRTVIANTYTSMWRRRWRGEVPTGDLPEPGPAARGGHDPISAVDDRDQLWDALGRLPRGQRAVVVLRFFEDLTEAQTAAALGVGVGTVKSQTSRALAAMRVDPGLVSGTGGAQDGDARGAAPRAAAPRAADARQDPDIGLELDLDRPERPLERR